MGFLSGLFSAVTKTVLTPIAVVKDIANIATGEEPNATKELLESAAKDVEQSVEDLGDGKPL